MEAQGQAGQAVDESTLRRAIAACAIGNATEWFDYATYGFHYYLPPVLARLRCAFSTPLKRRIHRQYCVRVIVPVPP